MYPVGTLFPDTVEITPNPVVCNELVSTVDQYEYETPLIVTDFFVLDADAAKAFILKYENIKITANNDAVISLNSFTFFTILPLN